MVMLVDLDQAKARLLFNDADDEDVELAIHSASAAVMNYLHVAHTNYDDSSGDVDLESVPFEVKQAVIALVGIWKRDPAGTEMDKWEPGYLPAPVTALLYSLRDPVLA